MLFMLGWGEGSFDENESMAQLKQDIKDVERLMDKETCLD
jgi:hypothetical protein